MNQGKVPATLLGVAGTVIALAGCAGQPQHQTPGPATQPPAASSTPTPSPTATFGLTEQQVIAVCQGSVQYFSHLSPDALTYTDVDVDEYEKRHYSVSGYVNMIDFRCFGISVDADGYWDQRSNFRVELGGVTMDDGTGYGS